MAHWTQRGKKSFQLKAYLGYDANGKKIQPTKTIRIEDENLLRTKRKLERYLDQEALKFQMEVEAGEYIKPGNKILADFIKDWEKHYAIEVLEESTLEQYHIKLNKYILPNLGHLKLNDIKPMHILRILESARKEGMSEATVLYIYRTIRNVLERAKEWEVIQNNPAATVKRPKVEQKRRKRIEQNVYSSEEVEQCFKLMKNELLHWQVFISLALACGFRRGELLALETKHIDENNSTIEIEQSIGRGIKGRPYLKDPKSFDGYRVVSVPNSVMVLLKQYLHERKKEKIKLQEKWTENNHDWLFYNINTGEHLYPSTPTTWWRRFTERVGLRYIRLHDLRHTSATLLINQQIHAKIISERLGHADIRITMDTYGHQIREADKKAAEALDNLFSMRNRVDIN